MRLEASNGKTLPALLVFAESLRYMEQHALNTIQEASSNTVCDLEEITWVITVPAIWSTAARQFMRLAAKEVKAVVNPLLTFSSEISLVIKGRGISHYLDSLYFEFLCIRKVTLP